MADPGTRAAADEPRSPWLRSGFVLAAAFIGFVTVIGGAVVLTSDPPTAPAKDEGATSARSSADPAADPDRSSSGSGGSGGGTCPELADKQQDVPTSAPRRVTWSLYDAVALPSSKASGPALAGRNVARCYAHTPVGALLASSQISVRYLAADDWRKVATAQTVGAGRDAYIAERTKSERKSATTEQGGGAHGQIAGFKFVTYNSSTAVIQTVWRFPDGRMQAATTTMLWQNGDWKLEYPADPAAPTQVGSLAGYTEWGGV
ncbi:hypothetical protein [Streptomyces daliensis]|uniref:DUF8175 domain-containing protein n=1 Tax=Streptomyces daliensis TaxID=299421 RepID=A0A8T4J1G7_9ACTN|nr:hypothetical protein [Streptomyces daliensis]